MSAFEGHGRTDLSGAKVTRSALGSALNSVTTLASRLFRGSTRAVTRLAAEVGFVGSGFVSGLWSDDFVVHRRGSDRCRMGELRDGRGFAQGCFCRGNRYLKYLACKESYHNFSAVTAEITACYGFT